MGGRRIGLCCVGKIPLCDRPDVWCKKSGSDKSAIRRSHLRSQNDYIACHITGHFRRSGPGLIPLQSGDRRN